MAFLIIFCIEKFFVKAVVRLSKYRKSISKSYKVFKNTYEEVHFLSKMQV